MNEFLWGVYPYLCIVLFFVVPIIRMAFRPFSWSTRASSLFNRTSLGVASLLLHWGLLLVLIGHLAGLFGGLSGSAAAVSFFYWTGLIGGLLVLLGSVIALLRRLLVPELRAMSQSDDYIVHLLLIPIIGLALYQVIAHQIFGIAYTASSWAASLWTLSPQPELMASASVITKLHVFLALTLFGYFPFTKLVHAWTYPINYFVRPYQSMRTVHNRFRRKWEFALRSDKSWMVYALGVIALVFVMSSWMLGSATVDGTSRQSGLTANGRLTGPALYISQCARCHGVSGRGDGEGAASPTLAAPPRDLVKGEYRFISTTNRIADDADLRRTIRVGLPLAGMPAFDHLSEAQVDSLIAVLDQLWKDRPQAGKRVEPPPCPPGTDALKRLGAQLYKKHCLTCHGEDGQGDGPEGVKLDPRPRDLAAGRLKAGSSPDELYVRIAVGIPPDMPASWHPEETKSLLSPREIWAVVYFLQSEFLTRH